MTLQERVERAIDQNSHEVSTLIDDFLTALNQGQIRAASCDERGNWTVHLWVKKGILLCFKHGFLQDMSHGRFAFYDKHTLPLKSFTPESGVRIVPGGSAIRTGAFIASGVICMPPMYVNIGAFVDEGTMIDSHALVGTCAQIGKRVHLSAAAQIGGVLEPAGARPVIIEDDVMIGGNCGVYEGVLVRKRAVLGSGVILNASTVVFDAVRGEILRSSAEQPLEIPAGAVVVPGTRPLDTDFGRTNGLSLSAPIIVKYRDEKTDAKTALEAALR